MQQPITTTGAETTARDGTARLVVEVSDLAKTYPGRSGPVRALEQVSFDVREREFVTVVGPSGCGKSTALKIVAGLVPRTSGTVKVFGEPVTGPVANVGMVFQAPVLLKWRTVLDNVLFSIDILRRDRRQYLEPAQALLRLVGLEGFEKAYPRELSGGMQQRVAIARALIHDPTLLLMDEPFGAVDAQMRTLLQDELLKICALTHTTVLFVTHSVEEAIYLSDRILIFSARPGRLVAEVNVDIPKPRYEIDARSDPRFAETRREVTRLLAERTDYYGRAHAAVHAD
jgi:NitT/TauT family transport system ATP-binding protein